MRTFNQPYENLTPAMALQLLKHGNFRFINNLGIERDHIVSVNETKDAQYPFAAIVSCMDSRTSPELIFDQGFGDIFSIRVAGNVISPDVLGSLEYATSVAGSNLIVVLGHTNCGAVMGACNHVKMGNLTGLLSKIEPAMHMEVKTNKNRDGKNLEYVNAVAKLHAIHSERQILEGSTIIRDLVYSGQAGIISAMYNISNGKVHFYHDEAILWKATEDIEHQIA